MNELAAIEQANRIKKWCSEYGISIITAIIIVTIISWGWNYWRQEQENKLLVASQQYEILLAATMHDASTTTLNSLASGLLKNYSYSPYASLAALQLAKRAVEENNVLDAKNNLLWVIRHGKDQALLSLARIRLARIFLAENQAARALTLLAENKNNAYLPMIFEEKGDVLLYLGHKKEALQQYVAAKQAFANSMIGRPSLEMKINNLA